MGKVRTLRRQLAVVGPLIERAARDQLLCELAAKGRLLPEGCSAESSFEVRWYFTDGKPLDWGCETWDDARSMRPPSGALRGEVRTREQWISEWSVVEQVEVRAPEGRTDG